MINKGIMVKWTHSIEYIEIDLNNFDVESRINNTIEWWKNERIWVKYNTTSEANKLNDDSIELIINYDSIENSHINPSDVCWGKSRVIIRPGETSGDAFWADAENEEANGMVKWVLVNVPLVGEKRRETVSRLQRKQDQFRKALLACDDCCVLTKEKTAEVLEAAHIIPASEGGTEVIGNGIILRADIHRLLDSKLISINTRGMVLINKEIASTYRDSLENSTIPKPTLKRIKHALEYLERTANSGLSTEL